MEIKYYGANCVKITTKKANIVIDCTENDTTPKATITDKDIVLQTNRELSYKKGGAFIVNSPGEYEISEVSITGIPSKLHFNPDKKSTIYSIHVAGYSVAVLGHSISELKDTQLEKLGVVDILIIPIGGGGYTLDSVEAVRIIKEVEPKIVIPTHFEIKGITYEVPQADTTEFLKSLSVTASDEPVEVLKLKDANLPEKTQVIQLKVQV